MMTPAEARRALDTLLTQAERDPHKMAIRTVCGKQLTVLLDDNSAQYFVWGPPLHVEPECNFVSKRTALYVLETFG